MRKYLPLLIAGLCMYTAMAIAAPTTIPGHTAMITGIGENPDLSKLKAPDIEKMIGRKLSLREKISWLFIRHKLKKVKPAKPDVDIDKKARKAKIFGTIALIGFFIPPLSLLSLPFAIVAIVMGTQVRRVDPDNRDARKAITRGIITLALMILTILIVAAVISAFTFA